MKRICVVLSLMLMALGLMISIPSEICASIESIKNWRVPWDEYSLNGKRMKISQGDHGTGDKFALDFTTSGRDNVIAVAPVEGRVVMSVGNYPNVPDDDNKDYGNFIKIETNDKETILLAHLKNVAVNQGAAVAKGQRLGVIGNTGKSSGIHLHFEIYGKKGKISELFGVSNFSTNPEIPIGISAKVDGYYKAVSGHHTSKITSKRYYVKSGGLNITGRHKGDGTDLLSLDTNGRIYYGDSNDIWLSLGNRDTAFHKESRGTSSGVEIWKWDTPVTEFTHYNPWPNRVTAHYYLTQVDINTIDLVVDHEYVRHELRLERSDARGLSSSSLSVGDVERITGASDSSEAEFSSRSGQ